MDATNQSLETLEPVPVVPTRARVLRPKPRARSIDLTGKGQIRRDDTLFSALPATEQKSKRPATERPTQPRRGSRVRRRSRDPGGDTRGSPAIHQADESGIGRASDPARALMCPLDDCHSCRPCRTRQVQERSPRQRAAARLRGGASGHPLRPSCYNSRTRPAWPRLVRGRIHSRSDAIGLNRYVERGADCWYRRRME